jgi:hypothetical protein
LQFNPGGKQLPSPEKEGASIFNALFSWLTGLLKELQPGTRN